MQASTSGEFAMPATPGRTVLLCHDGSEVSRHAIERAGAVLGGGTAVVLYVVRSVADYGLAPLLGPLLHDEEIDRALEEHASGLARDGVAIATSAGFDATPLVRHTSLPAWHAIVEAAGEVGADIVVAGTRGHSTVAEVLLGSVAHGLTNHCPVALLLVPAPAREG